MAEVICECGKQMEFDSIVIPGIEECEDSFVCECGIKKGYYEATEGL